MTRMMPDGAGAAIGSGELTARSSEPLARLSREFNTACVKALHAHELAALLESEGYSDAVVQERYGVANVFECAQRLFELVPYRPPPLLWRYAAPAPALWRDLLRGVIYLLPALWSASALSLGWGHGASLGLLVITLFGWGWMQGMAYLGYAGLASSAAAANVTLRRAGGLAVLLSAVLAGLVGAWQGYHPLQVGAVALCIAVYMAAATTLLVRGREGVLLISMLPAMMWLLAGVVRPEVAPAAQVLHAASVLLLASCLPLAAAWQATRPPEIQVPLAPTRPGALRLPRLMLAWPYALYGWLCAGFLMLGLLRPIPLVSSAGLTWTLLPVVLSMGVLELGLRHLHQYYRQLSNRPLELAQVIWRVMGRTLLVTVGYAALLWLGYMALPHTLLGRVGGSALPTALLLGHVQVAAALLLSSLLINFGLPGRVLAVWGLALASQWLLLPVLPGHLSYLFSAGGALGALTLLAVWALADIRHFK